VAFHENPTWTNNITVWRDVTLNLRRCDAAHCCTTLAVVPWRAEESLQVGRRKLNDTPKTSQNQGKISSIRFHKHKAKEPVKKEHLLLSCLSPSLSWIAC
jgi:hypothetical protein